jgi:hypothetical protein
MDGGNGYGRHAYIKMVPSIRAYEPLPGQFNFSPLHLPVSFVF